MNIQNILEGWKNDCDVDSLPEPIKELFDSRLKICRSNECGRLLIGICTACGCPVKKKTKVLEEECPENMWKPVKYSVGGSHEFVVPSELPKGLLEQYNGPTWDLNGDPIIYWEDWQKFLSLLNYEISRK